MKEITVAKFEPLGGHVAEDTIIRITDKVPEMKELGEGKAWFGNAKKWYGSQAETIADALFNSLPQGTLDRLLLAIMKRKVSLYAGKAES